MARMCDAIWNKLKSQVALKLSAIWVKHEAGESVNILLMKTANVAHDTIPRWLYAIIEIQKYA